MTITIRQRKPKNGEIKLYLDIYNPNVVKKRTSKTLDLFLYEKPSSTQRKSNKEVTEAAERIRSKMLIDLAYESKGLADLSDKDKSTINFIEYFQQQTDKRYESMNNYGNWDSVCKHLKSYCPEGIPINQVDPKWLEDFKYYLKNTAKTKSEKNLSQNTLHSYFNKVKASLRTALQEELIMRNPADRVKGFKEGETQREFLTLEELKKVAKAECEIPQLKRAFMFSVFTGMRWSDINKMVWSEIEYSEQDDYWRIRFRQKKTKGAETLPISEQAKEIMGEPGDPEERVFKGLKYSAWHNVKLQQWVMRGGVSKTITFHCARHTYATLQLSNGTDIYTLSKMLGHRDLKTTQVYAKIIDQTKIDATKAIPNIDID